MPRPTSSSRCCTRVRPEQFGDPTPCSGFDVAGIRDHIHGWLTYFGQALADPDGGKPRIDPTGTDAPGDPGEAAQAIRAAAARLDQAVRAGGADATVKLVGAALPGRAVLGMALWEYQVHGWDLARGAGCEWRPAEEASELSLAFAKDMLTDDYRGEGRDFAEQVDIQGDAPALERLLGFSGRDPAWRPPAA